MVDTRMRMRGGLNYSRQRKGGSKKRGVRANKRQVIRLGGKTGDNEEELDCFSARRNKERPEDNWLTGFLELEQGYLGR